MLRFPNAERGTLLDPLCAPAFSTTRLLGARVGGAPHGLVLRRMDGLFWRSNARARDDDCGHDAKAVSEAVGNKTGQDIFIHEMNDDHSRHE